MCYTSIQIQLIYYQVSNQQIAQHYVGGKLFIEPMGMQFNEVYMQYSTLMSYDNIGILHTFEYHKHDMVNYSISSYWRESK